MVVNSKTSIEQIRIDFHSIPLISPSRKFHGRKGHHSYWLLILKLLSFQLKAFRILVQTITVGYDINGQKVTVLIFQLWTYF